MRLSYRLVAASLLALGVGCSSSSTEEPPAAEALEVVIVHPALVDMRVNRRPVAPHIVAVGGDVGVEGRPAGGSPACPKPPWRQGTRGGDLRSRPLNPRRKR